MLSVCREDIHACLCQFSVSVTDLGEPARAGTNTAEVTFGVYRNMYCPYLSNLPTALNISETDTGVVFEATSNDGDSTVSIRSALVVVWFLIGSALCGSLAVCYILCLHHSIYIYIYMYMSTRRENAAK